MKGSVKLANWITGIAVYFLLKHYHSDFSNHIQGIFETHDLFGALFLLFAYSFIWLAAGYSFTLLTTNESCLEVNAISFLNPLFWLLYIAIPTFNRIVKYADDNWSDPEEEKQQS